MDGIKEEESSEGSDDSDSFRSDSSLAQSNN
jgi:hypothetical protein